MHSFSPQALRLLRRAGWIEERSVDVMQWERLLSDAGHPVSIAVVSFLREFGGLVFANPDAIPPAAEDWHFDVARALSQGGSRTRVRQYVRRLHTDLCPIGYGFGGYMALMMDDLGRVFGGYDQVFLYIGDSGSDAINALSDGRRLSPVAVSPDVDS